MPKSKHTFTAVAQGRDGGESYRQGRKGAVAYLRSETDGRIRFVTVEGYIDPETGEPHVRIQADTVRAASGGGPIQTLYDGSLASLCDGTEAGSAREMYHD